MKLRFIVYLFGIIHQSRRTIEIKNSKFQNVKLTNFQSDDIFEKWEIKNLKFKNLNNKIRSFLNNQISWNKVYKYLKNELRLIAT